MSIVLDAKPKAAIKLAVDGFKIFPLHSITKTGKCSCGYDDCSSPGKHPRPKNGVKAATDDLDKINAWWSDNKWSSANIGIATGDDLVVIDVDGETGMDSLRTLIKDQYFPDTLTASTGKGYHYYFRKDPAVPIRNSASKLGKSIDVRGEGGYVVSPPSNHVNGNQYHWSNQVEIAYLPAWISELMMEDEHEDFYEPTRRPNYTAINETHAYGKAVLKTYYNEISNTPEGGRNQKLNTAAYAIGAYVPHIITYDDAINTLMEAAYNCGLSPRETGKTIESGLHKGMNAPRYPKLTGETIEGTETEQIKHKTLSLIKLADIEKEKVEFFWQKRLPLGELSVLSGVGGLGKSFITMSLAAHVTAGATLPDCGSNTLRGNVVFVTYEDSLTKTMATRAESLGIDPNKFYVIDGVNAFGDGEYEMFAASHVQRLSEQIMDLGNVKMLVIDPLGSFLGNTDGNSETSVRALMAPLVKCAHDTNCVLLMVAHHKKGSFDGPAGATSQLISGSQAIGSYVRSVLQVAKDDEGNTYLVHGKHNLSAKQDTLCFEIYEEMDGSPGFMWLGRSEVTDEELFRKKSEKKAPVSADKFLKSKLEPGPMTKTDIFKEAREVNLPLALIDKAAARVGVTKKTVNEIEVWQLGDSQKQSYSVKSLEM